MNRSCLICGGTDIRDDIFNGISMSCCSGCDLVWHTNPKVNSEYYREEYNPRVGQKEKARISNARERWSILKKYISKRERVYDVGCGDGAFLKILKEVGVDGIGIEPNSAAVEAVRAQGLEVYQGEVDDILNIAGNKKVAMVTMFHVLEHLSDPLESLRVIRDILPEGGYLFMETPDWFSYSLMASGYRHELINKEHLFYYSFRNLEYLLERTGFKLIGRGRRDFNSWQMSITESLRRLGFLNYNLVEQELVTKKGGEVEMGGRRYGGWWRWVVKWVLSAAVMMLGRGDYIWVVAKKK